MVESCHQKIQTNHSEKNIFKIRNNLINLKLDPQNVELKEPKKNIGSFEVKNTYSPNARNSFNTYKHITKLRTIEKSKTNYNMTNILKTDLEHFTY